ncbi:hypothetical protein niasHT_000248 [Heterodera trifolii]
MPPREGQNAGNGASGQPPFAEQLVNDAQLRDIMNVLQQHGALVGFNGTPQQIVEALRQLAQGQLDDRRRQN